MKKLVNIAIFCMVSSTVLANSGLDGWFQNTDGKYQVEIDNEQRATGNSSAMLYSLSDDKYGEGELLQTLSPCPITDGNLRISAFLRSERVSGAGLIVDVMFPYGGTQQKTRVREQLFLILTAANI